MNNTKSTHMPLRAVAWLPQFYECFGLSSSDYVRRTPYQRQLTVTMYFRTVTNSKWKVISRRLEACRQCIVCCDASNQAVWMDLGYDYLWFNCYTPNYVFKNCIVDQFIKKISHLSISILLLGRDGGIS